MVKKKILFCQTGMNYMMLEINDLITLYPEKLWLELSSKEQQLAWQISTQEYYSNSTARWNAYLNCLCLNAFLNCLKEDPDLDETPNVRAKL